MSARRPGFPPTGPSFYLAPASGPPPGKGPPPRQHIVGRQHILQELIGRGFPAIGQGVLARITAIQLKRAHDRLAQILMQHAGRRVGDHVLRSADRIGRNGHAARHGFQQDQAERVGEAREDEDVGRGVCLGQLLAVLRPGEDGVRVFLGEGSGLRPSPRQHLLARQIEGQECLDVLLNRDPADIEEDGVLAEKADVPGPEKLGVDAAGPRHQALKAFASQLFGKRGGGDEGAGCAAVKPALHGIAEGERHGQPGGDVFRKAGVVAGGEGPLAGDAIAARHQPYRAFRGDMDEVRRDLLDQARDLPRPGHGQADLRIGWARDGAEILRRQETDFLAAPRHLARQALIGADDAVDLGMPRIGGDKHLHQAAASSSSSGKA